MSYFTVLNTSGPRIRHGSHGGTFLRNVRRAHGRRVILPGFPCVARDLTDTELAEYFSSDLLTCLLCGKTYRRLARHLPTIHSISEDQYRERYGIAYGQSLTGALSHAAYQQASIHDAEWMRSIRELRSGRKVSSRVSAPKRRRSVENGIRHSRVPHEAKYGPADVVAILETMRSRDLTFSEAIQAAGTIGESTAREIIRSCNMESLLSSAWEAISFRSQARGERLGTRFVESVRQLRPLSDKKIAAKLGVSTMTVWYARQRAGVG